MCPPLPGKWAVEQLKENIVPGDKGLVLKSRAKHHAIAALLAKPFVFEDEPLVLQYVSLRSTFLILLLMQAANSKSLAKSGETHRGTSLKLRAPCR